MSRYPNIESGQRLRLRWRRQDLKMACCDCGLVHRFRFDVKRGVLTVRGWRDNRATGQMRRRRHA